MRHPVFQLILQLLVLVFLTSCGKNTVVIIPPEKPSEDDYKIINSTFVHLISPILREEMVGRKFGYDNFDRSKQEIPVEFLDTVYMTPFLPTVNKVRGYDEFQYLTSEKLDKIKDEQYRHLADQLLLDTSDSLDLELDKITNTGIHVIADSDLRSNLKLDFGEKWITYSKIVYNDEGNKACFYFNCECGGLCGFGELVLVEKGNDGIWRIVGLVADWIA